MNKSKNCNIRVIAQAASHGNYFDIYLMFPDHREYLMSHRNNEQLYDILRNGVRLEDLRNEAHKKLATMAMSGNRYYHGGIHPRLKSHKNRSQHLENMVNHLVSVVEEYLREKEDGYYAA